MKSNKVLAAILSSISLLSSSAFASHYKGELPPTGYRWTGWYAGINGGVVNHAMDITDTKGASYLSTLHQVTNPSMTGGLQVGYRHEVGLSEMAGVYGLELSANISNAAFNKQYGSPFSFYQLNFQHQLKNTALLEAIGGIAANKTLLFLAGGLSWVNIEGKTTNQDAIAFFNSFNVSNQVFGTALGGGIEYAFDDKMSVRFKVDVIMPTTYSVYDNTGNSYLISNSVVQAVFGLNYKFA